MSVGNSTLPANSTPFKGKQFYSHHNCREVFYPIFGSCVILSSMPWCLCCVPWFDNARNILCGNFVSPLSVSPPPPPPTGKLTLHFQNCQWQKERKLTWGIFILQLTRRRSLLLQYTHCNIPPVIAAALNRRKRINITEKRWLQTLNIAKKCPSSPVDNITQWTQERVV